MQGLPFGEVLKAFRKQKRLSQPALAGKLGVHRNTISSWEQGAYLPDSRGMVVELAKQLCLNEQETRILLEASLIVVSFYWQVPFARNPFFTGREDVLAQLHTMLTQRSSGATTTQSYALHGIGGIGKTQLAIEYAYRHRYDYEAILWIQAETQTTLVSSFVALADQLSLFEKTEEDQSKIVAAVLRWLNRHKGWLLILDNVEDLSLLKPFLPATDQGALLLTTRLQDLGTLAQTVELSPMTMQEGHDFLLVRTKRLHQDEERAPIDLQEEIVVQQIVSEMEGLPLALEQAGAYIEATQCTPSDYLHLFRTAQYRLLNEHEPSSDHPLSVSRTFALAFKRVEQRNRLAAELLTVCAFLAPEAIPETFLLEGGSSLDPTFEALMTDPLAFSEAIKVLLSYSLIQRQATTHTIIVHRLVQAVLKGRLSEATQRIWARRVIELMARHFPSSEGIQADYWTVCEQLLPHAQRCLFLSDQWKNEEALRLPLMSHVATYLTKRAQYTQAEPLFIQAIHMGEQAPGPQHPLVAEALHGLATLYLEQNKYAEAEPLFVRTIHIREQMLGARHPLTATSLERLALLYCRRGKYDQAEPLLQRALSINKQAFGPEHPQVAQDLISLGILYHEQSKYDQAEPLLQRALSINKQAFGPEHPQVALPMNNLGNLYYRQGKYEQAESLYQDVLRIWQQALGSEHPRVANPLNNLGALYYEQGKYEQAESLYQRALHIWQHSLGPECSQVAYLLNNLGELYYEQGKYEQAESLYQRALRIWQETFGPEHPLVAHLLNDLGELYYEQGKYEQAESLYQRALHIWQQVLGSEHPQLAYPLNGLANLYREQGKYEQTESLYQRALMLRQQHLGLQHLKTAETLHDLACFYHLQRQTKEAFTFYQEALAIREQVLGQEHPKTEKTHSALKRLLQEIK